MKRSLFWDGHKILEISTLPLSYVVPVKSKVKISQNFVAFSEYINFILCPEKDKLSQVDIVKFLRNNVESNKE